MKGIFLLVVSLAVILAVTSIYANSVFGSICKFIHHLEQEIVQLYK